MPPGRWVFSDQAVDGLSDQVSVTGVSAILLEKVKHESAQTRLLSIRRGHVNGLVKVTIVQCRRKLRTRSFDGAVPERVKLLRAVVGCRVEVPVVVIGPVTRTPRLVKANACHSGGEHVILDGGKVF